MICVKNSKDDFIVVLYSYAQKDAIISEPSSSFLPS